MKQALYRNWRPRSFKELIGQEHITTTLEKALKAGRISHAYLFTGPRGVGKTSAARILAHSANDLPYTGENTHLDIIEIDAASNRRIDEIRDLRDKVAIAPAVGKYKVYIIDEVHMLTREAFNALLKTLEEPPAHTIFILATTEAHKLPETIVSRTQRFEFKPLPAPKMAKHLQKIAKNEAIDITPEALTLLAEFGGGSFRDSISYLDQLSTTGGKITDEQVRQVLGLPPENVIKQIVDQVLSGDNQSVIGSIDSLKETGVEASVAAAAIAKQVRQKMIEGTSHPALVHLLKQLIDVPASHRPYDLLEVIMLEAGSQYESSQQPGTKVPTQAAKQPSQKSQATAIITETVDKPAIAKAIIFDVSLWPKVVDGAKQKAASLYTALRLAKPEVSAEVLTLKFQFPLHQKKLAQEKNKILIENLIEELTGQKITIDCIVDKTAFKQAPKPVFEPTKPVSTDPKSLNSINSIFGIAEVMEA